MKTMTCNQLGGACGLEFHANTFDEIVEISKGHGMQMLQQQDAEHLAAMKNMQALMQQPDAMKNWFEDKRQAFNALPED